MINAQHYVMLFAMYNFAKAELFSDCDAGYALHTARQSLDFPGEWFSGLWCHDPQGLCPF